jgi:hypothetical protein
MRTNDGANAKRHCLKQEQDRCQCRSAADECNGKYHGRDGGTEAWASDVELGWCCHVGLLGRGADDSADAITD